MQYNHIFISYRSLEVRFALKLATDLRNVGAQVWMDALEHGIRGGQDWVQSIQDNVDNCSAMIAIISPDYVQSKYCRRELQRADALDKPIIPIMLYPLASQKQWPIEIQEKQYIPFCESDLKGIITRDWQNTSIYDNGLTKLIEVLIDNAPAQMGKPPDTETQYLNSLVSELEGRRGVTQYVELYADDITTPDIRPQPIHIDEWAYDVLISKHLNERTSDDLQFSNIRDAVNKYNTFVLIGEPGAGKTTILRHLAQKYASTRLHNHKTDPIPLLLYLAEWRSQNSLEEFINEAWPFSSDPLALIKSGDIVLLLDGLNEMGVSSINHVHELRSLLNTLDDTQYSEQATIIISCRIGDYDEGLNLNLPVVAIRELSDEQIEHYAKSYLGKTTQDFIDRLTKNQTTSDSNPLLRLSRNPYMLSALILLFEHSSTGNLPHNMGKLFQRLALTLWSREEIRQGSGVSRISFESAQKYFGKLAYYMIDNNLPLQIPVSKAKSVMVPSSILKKPKIDRDLLFKYAQGANWIEIEDSKMRFYHHLMLEYFAATAFDINQLKRKIHAPEFISGNIRKAQKWDKVIVALSGITTQRDFIERIAQLDLFLAAECIASGSESETAKQFVIEYLKKNIVIPDDANRRLQAAYLLEEFEWSPKNEQEKVELLIAKQQWEGIIGYGETETSALLQVYEDSVVRHEIIKLLGKLGDPSARDELLIALQDFDPTTRELAARALRDNNWYPTIEKETLLYHSALSPLSKRQRILKRVMDITISSLFLLMLFPLLTFIIIAIRLDSPGPIIFRQNRYGEGRKTIKYLKFRTMIINVNESISSKLVDQGGDTVYKLRNDPRVTRLGRVLRKTSLDELPQLINILRGDMSLVGPRPELPYLVDQYEPWQYERFSVPQGLTGWWQVNGRSEKPALLGVDEDIWYINNYSLWLDIKILLMTIPAILKGKGAF